jgi:hypothetical protein
VRPNTKILVSGRQTPGHDSGEMDQYDRNALWRLPYDLDAAGVRS